MLPRVLAEMKLGRYRCTIRRGYCSWWPPNYFALRRITVPGDAEYREAMQADWLQRERARLGRINRAIRDSPVRVYWLDPDGGRTLLVDEAAGAVEWRTMDGHNTGAGLISLAQWRWGLDFAPAAYRLARIIGLDPIPTK